jgi:hypothetical protein
VKAFRREAPHYGEACHLSKKTNSVAIKAQDPRRGYTAGSIIAFVECAKIERRVRAGLLSRAMTITQPACFMNLQEPKQTIPQVTCDGELRADFKDKWESASI